MVKPQQFNDGLLSLTIIEDSATITVEWIGKSVAREPALFITPILVRLIKKCSDQKKRLILDFRHLAYLNSSTITPIIKILERAKRGSSKITVLYNSSLKWQDLIFSALTIFKTADKRVVLQGEKVDK